MQGNDIGVILRRQFPLRNAVTILSRSYGKIEARISPADAVSYLWPGMIITSVTEEKTHGFVLHTPIIEFAPEMQHLRQLEWLHYLLYVCIHIAPPAAPVPEIFDFLWQVVTIDAELSQVTLFQESSLVQLLSLFGFCNHEVCRPFLLFFQQMTSFVDHEGGGRVHSAGGGGDDNVRELRHLAPRVKQQIMEALALHPRLRERRIIGFGD